MAPYNKDSNITRKAPLDNKSPDHSFAKDPKFKNFVYNLFRVNRDFVNNINIRTTEQDVISIKNPKLYRYILGEFLAQKKKVETNINNTLSDVWNMTKTAKFFEAPEKVKTPKKEIPWTAIENLELDKKLGVNNIVFQSMNPYAKNANANPYTLVENLERVLITKEQKDIIAENKRMKAMEIAAKPINFILDSAIKKNNHASTIVVNSTIPRNKKNSIRYSEKLDQIKYGNKYDAPALQPNTIQSNINVNNGKKKILH